MATFFTADHHFGDGRRLGIDRRPFGSTAEMDRAMAAAWNAAVGPDDVVWHLGDVTRLRDGGQIQSLLSGLHGTKHLVVGNNDGPETRTAPGFATVSAYAEIEVEGHGLVLCHYALRTWNGMARGRLNLHGHSHGRLSPMARQHDVGVHVWDFRPVRLGEILANPRRRRTASGRSPTSATTAGPVTAES